MKFLRVLTLVSCVMLAGQSICAAESPKSKEALLEQFQTGITSKNIDLLYGLFYMEGVADETKAQMKEALGILAASEITEFAFAEVPADYDPVRVTPTGVKIAPNMEIQGFIKFNIKSAEGWEGVGSQPFGSIDGNYYLPGSLIK